MAAGSDDDQWQFSLEELDDDPDAAGADDGTDDSDGGNVAGTLARGQPLEPGEIDLENAAFVALGALLVVGLIGATMLGL